MVKLFRLTGWFLFLVSIILIAFSGREIHILKVIAAFVGGALILGTEIYDFKIRVNFFKGLGLKFIAVVRSPPFFYSADKLEQTLLGRVLVVMRFLVALSLIAVIVWYGPIYLELFERYGTYERELAKIYICDGFGAIPLWWGVEFSTIYIFKFDKR